MLRTSWGTAAFFLPSTRWHVGLMDFENCPICRGVPQGVLPAEYVKDTRGHSRNETEKWPGHTAAEVTLMNLAGGAAEVVCCGDQIRQVNYLGDGVLYPAGMDGDLTELLAKLGNVLTAKNVHSVFESLVEFFSPRRDELLRYAATLVEKRILRSDEVSFSFDPAPLVLGLFQGDPRLADPRIRQAYQTGVCYECGKVTASWGWCLACRENRGRSEYEKQQVAVRRGTVLPEMSRLRGNEFPELAPRARGSAGRTEPQVGSVQQGRRTPKSPTTLCPPNQSSNPINPFLCGIVLF